MFDNDDEREIRRLAREAFDDSDDRPDFDEALLAADAATLAAIEEIGEDEAAEIYGDEYDRLESETESCRLD